MPDVNNIRIGVASVKMDGVDLGHTKGGVEISYSAEYEDITVDSFGDTVVDKVLKAEKFTAKIPLAEITIENIKKAIPAGTLTTNGGKKKLTIGNVAGYKLSSSAKQIVLHPVANQASDISEDIVIHKAVIISETKLAMKYDGMDVIEIEVLGLVDQTRTSGNYIATIGDTTI